MYKKNKYTLSNFKTKRKNLKSTQEAMYSAAVPSLPFFSAWVWSMSGTHAGAWTWHGRGGVPGCLHMPHKQHHHSSCSDTVCEV